MAWITGKRGSYRVCWRDGGRGAPIQTSEMFEAKDDAAAEKRSIEERTAKADRIANPKASTGISELLEAWELSRIGRGKVRAPYAVEFSATIKAMAKAQKWARVADITSASVEAWCAKKGVRGVNKPLQNLKTFLRWCRRIHKIRVDDYVYDIESATVDSREQPPLLSDTQVARIIALAYQLGGENVGTAVAHLALYPRRPIELCRMATEDWNSADRIVTYRHSKNKHTSRHAVHDQHAARLDAIAVKRPPGSTLFVDQFGRPWRVTKKGSPDGMVSWYRHVIGKRLLPKSQWGIGCLKDYAMTRFNRAAGGDRKAVISISGHLTPEMVDTYSGSNAESQRALIACVPWIEPAAEVEPVEGAPTRRKSAPKAATPLAG